MEGYVKRKKNEQFRETPVDSLEFNVTKDSSKPHYKDLYQYMLNIIKIIYKESYKRNIFYNKLIIKFLKK